MFVVSVKASTVKFIVCLFLMAGILGALFYFAAPEFVSASAGVYRFDNADTEDGRRLFLRQFGWETTGDSVESVTLTLPEEFDRVMLGYNEIQRSQGLDLSRYRKKSVTRYTYEIENCDETDSKVYANVIVYRGRVIGGDISTADPTGFVRGFMKPGETLGT